MVWAFGFYKIPQETPVQPVLRTISLEDVSMFTCVSCERRKPSFLEALKPCIVIYKSCGFFGVGPLYTAGSYACSPLTRYAAPWFRAVSSGLSSYLLLRHHEVSPHSETMLLFFPLQREPLPFINLFSDLNNITTIPYHSSSKFIFSIFVMKWACVYVAEMLKYANSSSSLFQK